MNALLSWLALKVLPASIAKYVAFYFKYRPLIHDLIAKFRREFPEAKPPAESDVMDALSESSAGRIAFTPKKVREWTPAEWESFWSRGSGGV